MADVPPRNLTNANDTEGQMADKDIRISTYEPTVFPMRETLRLQYSVETAIDPARR